MTDLSGFELRKELCETLGWKLCHYDDGRYAESEADYRDAFTNDGWQWDGSGYEKMEAWEFKPESDATLSEALLDKVCQERGWYWQVTYLTYAHAPEQNRYACVIGGADGLHFDPLREDGSTPSEARSRCLLSALKADTR